MKLASLALSFLLLGPAVASAQSAPSTPAAPAGTVSGTVTDAVTHEPLEYASVALRSRSDTTRVTGTLTDARGAFAFANVLSGSYIVECSMMGRKSWRSAPFAVGSAGVALGTIPLRASVMLLDEIEVRSERSLFHTDVDRRVYNVEKDVMAKSSTVSGLLRNIPSVQVDIDGNVSLRGSQDVMILVNGRKSTLMGAKTRADVLDQMSAATVSQIEVITNPSARFTPEGASGIINIVTKKSGGPGVTGDASGHLGTADRNNTNLTFGWHPGSMDVFATYSDRDDFKRRLGTDNRVLPVAGTSRSYSEDSQVSSRPDVHMGSLGVTWHASKQDELELSSSYMYRRPRRNGIATIVQQEGGSVLTDHDRVQTGHELQHEAELTAGYQHDFAKDNRTLRAEATLANMRETEFAHFVEHWRTPSRPDPASDIVLQDPARQGQFSLDYEDPLGKDTKLETGYALELSRQRADSDADSLDVAGGSYVPDPVRSYRFRLDQQIHAVYATLERPLGKLGLLAGLRGEYAIVQPDLLSGGSRITNRYAGLYPTLHLGYKTKSGRELQLSYSRRIKRPDVEDLNPFPTFTDPYNIEAGNPNLKPESTHSLELAWRVRWEHFAFLPSLYYRFKNDGFTKVTRAVNDSTFLRTVANLQQDQSAGIEPVVTFSLGRYAQGNVNGNVFYERIDASNLGFTGRRSVWSWSGVCNLAVTPRPGTFLEVNPTYKSARLTPQGDQRPSFVLNAGARQDFLGERLSLTVAVSDVFQTQRSDTNLDVGDIHQHVRNRRDSRIVYVGLGYHYGTPAKKSKDKGLEYDDSQ